MKIAVLIPTRNDRQKLEANCLRMIQNQTLKPDIIELVNDEPLNFNADGYLEPEKKVCDITWRYRTGYDRLRNKGIDCILLMENDDWYAPDYIEKMVSKWIENGKPDLSGTNYTIYYHLKMRAYFQMNHTRRSSAMSTLIKPDLNFPWCVDHEPYTDMWLWELKQLTKVVFDPGKYICLGMKHGEGFCGGRSHVDKLERYRDPKRSFQDDDFSFLKKHLDPQSFDFYSTYFNNGTETV